MKPPTMVISWGEMVSEGGLEHLPLVSMPLLGYRCHVNPEEEPPPNWQKLLLPPGLGVDARVLPPASLEAHVDLGGLFPVEAAFSRMKRRKFWLSTLHSGRISLQGAWTEMGKPEEVAVLAFHTDPGAALIDASRLGEGPKYETRKVGRSGASARVSLPAPVLHRLQLAGDGEQVLLAMAGRFLVMLNPHWASELSFWDSIDREKG